MRFHACPSGSAVPLRYAKRWIPKRCRQTAPSQSLHKRAQPPNCHPDQYHAFSALSREPRFSAVMENELFLMFRTVSLAGAPCRRTAIEIYFYQLGAAGEIGVEPLPRRSSGARHCTLPFGQPERCSSCRIPGCFFERSFAWLRQSRCHRVPIPSLSYAGSLAFVTQECYACHRRPTLVIMPGSQTFEILGLMRSARGSSNE